MNQTFSLALQEWPYPPTGLAFANIDFEAHGDDIFEPPNVVLDTLPIRALQYGNLFTYCFRRFGYPNRGSDSYKDIASWQLKTPHPELFLLIRPSVLPEPHFSLVFYAQQGLVSFCTHYERRDLDAWKERQLNWAEAQRLPEWMPSFVEHFAKQTKYPEATWRDAYVGYIAMFTPSDHRTARPKDDPRIVEFAAKVDSYCEIEPRPAWNKRSPVLADWPEDDPMKPLALAAITALKDLSTAVRVRDSAINAYGLVEDGYEDVVSEPPIAGRAFGGMLNVAPEECANLYRSVMDLGNGNVKSGIARLLKDAKLSKKPGAKKEPTQCT